MKNYYVEKFKKETKRFSIDKARIIVYLILYVLSGISFGFAIFYLQKEASSLPGLILLSLGSSIFAGIFTTTLLDISSRIKQSRTKRIKIKHYVLTVSFDIHRIINVFLKNKIDDNFMSDFEMLSQRVISNKEKYKGVFKGAKKQIVRYIVQIETETNLFLTDIDSFNFFENEYEKESLSEILPICYEIKSFDTRKDELELVTLVSKLLNYLKRFKKMNDKFNDDIEVDSFFKKDNSEYKYVEPIKLK